MIKKIDIESFGSYTNFKHDKNLDSPYKELNICYGKNYSGKSTFSKIFQAFELNELPDKYDEIKFSLKLDTDAVLTEENVSNSNVKTRVFNSEYIRRNLNFFGEEGINSFALLGDNNIKIETKINQLEIEHKKLTESSTRVQGLFQGTKEKFESTNRSWERSKTRFASSIRQDNNLVLGSYDKRNFEREINIALQTSSLGEEQIATFKQSIIEDEKVITSKQKFFNIDFSRLLESTNYLLEKIVRPSTIIKEIEDSSRKKQWVKDGMHLHKNNGDLEEKCVFCGNVIKKDRYDVLDQFFSEEISNFEKELNNFLNKLNSIKGDINSISVLNKNDFYAKYHVELNSINNLIQIEKNKEISFLDELILSIERKIASMFLAMETLKINTPSGFYSHEENINDLYNILYESNKDLSDRLEENKKLSREALRMDFIKQSLENINYTELTSKLSQLEDDYRRKNIELRDVNDKINENSKMIEGYRAQLSNEKIAAKEINSYLNNYLGHEELYLDVHENEGAQSRFVVFRRSQTAYNLSEGEMTLIAFAYFLASLKKEPEEDKSDTIIFVDDPISSLDENNIFYIYSLIQSEIINKCYAQVFITTHNLDFLKYSTKYKISGSQTKYIMINKNKKSDGTWESKIQDMPKYMSNKVTEFNFLFEQIYAVASEQQNDNNYHAFYNFPNNARKFLETLLFFKYPSYKNRNNDSSWRFREFFGEGVSEPFVNRINNEYSHGLDRFDRLTKQVSTAEFCKDAILILQTIKEKDIAQYQSLLDNSSLPDREWINGVKSLKI